MGAEIAGETEKAERKVVDQDLSAEIVQSIARTFDEKVTCRRISGHNYRCNWWSPSVGGQDNPRMGGLLVTTHVVRKSKFLNVTKTEKGLTIKDASAPSQAERNR